MLYPIASLETDKIEAVKNLENEIGSTVLALSKIEAGATSLSKENLERLQALEDELDVVLVAVQPS